MKTTKSEINQALAKALAYADCGQFDKAQAWGACGVAALIATHYLWNL